jgi:hypothetical protein
MAVICLFFASVALSKVAGHAGFAFEFQHGRVCGWEAWDGCSAEAVAYPLVMTKTVRTFEHGPNRNSGFNH